MRLGSMILLVSLCLGLGAFETGILKAVWGNEAGQIDPWGQSNWAERRQGGRCLQGSPASSVGSNFRPGSCFAW
jgi:hypothetical protein